MKKFINVFAFAMYFAVAAYSSSASAVTIIDFRTGLAGPGGTLSYDGTDVVGTDIPIGALEVLGAPQGNGVYAVDAVLNFDTAANTISIFGTVDVLVGLPTELLTGSFDSFSFMDDGTNQTFEGAGPDVKACALLCEIGVDPSTPFEFFGISIEGANGVVVSTDIVNTAVPVPAAVWLFGTGLLGLIGVARRRA